MSEDLFLQRYSQLNSKQKQAVDAIEGPVMVVAGPGSGKTELLSLRVANILRNAPDITASNILCLTYTEAGATNMRQRLAGLIGHQAYKVTINTFHGFSSDIIGRYGEYFYSGATLQPADDLTKIEILQNILNQLSHDDPLASQFLGTHTYIKDISSAIGDLKKAGLTPDQFAYLLEKNQVMVQAVSHDIQSIFSGTVDQKSLPAAQELVAKMRALSLVDQEQSAIQLGQFDNILTILADSLELAITQSQGITRYAPPLTKWKNDFTKKDATGLVQLKEQDRLPKLLSLATIYQRYQEAMTVQRFYDFDDMVLDVLNALASQPALGYALQEQYQYILVDEFQDTNDAQMRLLAHLTSAELHEGRPNIMVVGDDDQAIYKFQGATISNIHQFTQRYSDPQVIVLTDNYRSSQRILDVSRQIIIQGQDRLETIQTDIIKELTAQGQHARHQHQPQFHLYQTQEQEFSATAQAIKDHLDSIGWDKAAHIAVICARRKDLEQFALHLGLLGVPVRYDRQKDVLQEPHIHQLIQMARFIAKLSRHQQAEADDLLPEILSYPFWNIDRQTLWQLAVNASLAKQQQRLWLDQMDNSDHPRLVAISQWFKQLRLLSETESIETILEHLIGAHTPLLPADEDSDIDWLTDNPSPVARRPSPEGEGFAFASPFKDFYFDTSSNQAIDQGRYVSFLSSLQVFIKKLRAYRPGQMLKLDDLLTFVDLHLANDIKITDTSVYASGSQAVQLLTAHGAKGLEYDTVYLLSCVQPVWVSKGWTNKLTFSDNMPIAMDSDNLDDKLRLFFVAVTRAKQQLFLSAYNQQSDGKEVQQLGFLVEVLAGQQVDSQAAALDKPAEVLAESWKTYHQPPVQVSEQAILLPLVENYQLSITHLNDFLDVTRNGPQDFLQQHLLRFPQPKSTAQAYGTAVHEALRQLFEKLRFDTTLPSIDFLQQAFVAALESERLNNQDHRKLLERGQQELDLYYQSKSSAFNPQDIVERNFANQQVIIGQACLGGKIDRIVQLRPGIVSVHDIKTGKPSDKWTGAQDYQKIKLTKYRRQLLFYKLLVENSRDFGDKMKVEQGILEFIEPNSAGKFVELPLELNDLQSDLDQLQQLIQVVYQHIQQLNFPDTSHYSPTSAGAEQFIEDLLQGTI